MSRTEDVLGALQLLAAMYPLEGELSLSAAAESALAAAEAGEEYSPAGDLEAVVRVALDEQDGDGGSPRVIEVAAALPLDAPVRLSVRQPAFLPRAEFTDLEAGLPAISEDNAAGDAILAAIQYVRTTGSELAAQVAERAAERDAASGGQDDQDDGELSRVWLWLPGLETREKRRDLVEYAPAYGLTGFVLAGKPGLICLEGGGKAADRYMADIKSTSWGDVPSFQKKVRRVEWCVQWVETDDQ
jgi:hypothetical protein